MNEVLTLTNAARDKVLEVRAAEADADNLGLWVEVSGVQNGAFTYTMEFRRLDDFPDGSLIQHHDDLTVIIDGDSVDKLHGAVLELAGGGMVMQNPNRPTSPSLAPVAPVDLSDPVALAVHTVLEEHINPQIAAHGGHAELVAVDGNIAYLRLGGGCQGCGMAAVTLSQGIEVAILDAVPQITEVIDVTDHAAGASPYYEAAKK